VPFNAGRRFRFIRGNDRPVSWLFRRRAPIFFFGLAGFRFGGSPKYFSRVCVKDLWAYLSSSTGEGAKTIVR